MFNNITFVSVCKCVEILQIYKFYLRSLFFCFTIVMVPKTFSSVISKPVKIGKGAVVGAGSVVTKDIPDGEVWAGNPARFIRKRETIAYKI